MRWMLVVACLVVCALPAMAAEPTPAEMMHDHLLKQVNATLDRRAAEYEKIKTPADVAAWQKARREWFLEALGGFPERTPLNARVVGQESRDGYRIEKVIYESQPRHYVTGVVFLPLSAGPHPGVIVPCGHSANGKAAEAYQRVCILLAKNGLVALCYDPIGQGERLQILPAEGEKATPSTLEHTLVGVSSIPLGTNTARYRIWDGMRSLDYLASRPDVDPKRLGCTGNSGGGTLTSYLMALDDRIVCAAPSCYLTSFRDLLNKQGPQDAEQNIHGQLAAGFEMADFLNLRAPKPTLMCCATRDMFGIEGSWDTFREAKRTFARLRHSERVEMVESDAVHGFTIQLREGAVRWMRRWLLGVDDAVFEGDFPIMSDQQMQCTPDGQTLQLPGARSVFDLNADWEARLATERKKQWAATDRTVMLDRVRKLAGVRPVAQLPQVKAASSGTVVHDGRTVEKLAIEIEQGLKLSAVAYFPNTPTNKATLYLHDKSKEADAGAGGAIDKLVNNGNVVLAVDLRGLGETLPSSKSAVFGELIGPSWRDYFMAYLLGKSYVGLRAEDVLVAGRFLAGYRAENGPREVNVVAIGEAGPAALHAVALEPQQFKSLTLERSLASWADVVRTPLAKNQLTSTVHGALRAYDLPDLVATLPADKVKIVELQNALRQPVAERNDAKN